MATVKKRPTPPNLALFLAALRWQESGSPQGNYVEPNGQGAYQIVQSNWPAWAASVGYKTNDPDASHAPAKVQDQVAAAKVTEYYYGAGEKNYRLVARIWNGGTPNVVPNPALGAGATTDTYASQVLSKVNQLAKLGIGFYGLGGKALTQIEGDKSSPTTAPSCVHQLHIGIKLAPDVNLCMDKPLALAAMTGGTLLLLGGVTVIMVAAFRQTAAGRAAAGALAAVPAGKAATAIGAAAGAARPSQRRERATVAEQTRQGAEARRLAPVNTETRRATAAAAAERRRSTAHRRAGTAAAQRVRHREEIHGQRQQRLSTARVRSAQRAGTRNRPAEYADPPTRTAPRRPTRPLPDQPPF